MAPNLPVAIRRWLTPSLVDVFFLALFLILFAQPHGLESLLCDGDTGWHIRTGELVLKTGHVPVVDPFSFSRPSQPWFAWEWLSDVAFALLYRWRGLAAVAAASGVVLALASTVLFARLLRRGAGLWLALAVALAASSASSLHYLARPHVFSILFYTVAIGVLERDFERPSWRLWLLVPLAVLWAGLHAGFVILPATLVLAAVCSPGHRRLRYAAAALAAGVATLANPYGWHLHEHIWKYLNSAWIMEHVQEFQSPSIRSEGSVVFAVLLLAAVAVASRATRFEGAMVLVWGYLSLRSARHVPFFAITAAPVLASVCADAWRKRSATAGRQSPIRIFWELSQDLGKRWRGSFWLLVSASLVLLAMAQPRLAFPESSFPERAVERNPAYLSAPTRAGMPRVLTSDQWGDYLIFRLYPAGRVFFDGRSDFYGPAIGGDYRKIMNAEDGWRQLLIWYDFSTALLPRDWALSTMLDREPGWRLVYRDSVAALYTRQPDPAAGSAP